MITTTSKFNTIRIAGAGAALALVFTACGSDDDSADSAANEAPEEAPAEEPAEEAPAEEPAEEPAEAPAEEAPAEEPAEEAPAADGPVAVAIVDFNYDPNPVEVAAGTTITWTNEDSFAHTVTNDGGDFEFDSGNFGEGETFEMAFDEAGEFAYICTIHNQMKATIVVS